MNWQKLLQLKSWFGLWYVVLRFKRTSVLYRFGFSCICLHYDESLWSMTAGLGCVGITCIFSIQNLFGHVLVSWVLSHAQLQVCFSDLLLIASYFLNFVARRQGSLRRPMQVTNIVDIREGMLTSNSGYLNASCCCICDQGMLLVSQMCLQVSK